MLHYSSYHRDFLRDGLNVLGNGIRNWYDKGVLHREDGPAVEYPNGSREWRVRGYLHRADGPAVERINRDDQEDQYIWYFEGRMITRSKDIKAGQRRFEKLRDQSIMKEIMEG